MAKNKSFIKLDGTLDGLTFYRANGQDFVKTKGEINRQRILTDPAFARTRENMVEFGGAATAGKAFRAVFAVVLKVMADSYMGARANAIIKRILNLGTGPRGQREINMEGNGYLLKGFDFNTTPFTSIFFAPNTAPTVSAGRDSLSWTVADFNTQAFVRAPEGATHFKLVLAGGYLSNYQYQMMMGLYEPENPNVNAIGGVSYSDAIPLGGMVGADTTLTLDLSSVGTVPVTSILLGAVGIVFYQQVNADFYELAQNNAMKVVVIG